MFGDCPAEEYFAEILCAPVIEHFWETVALEVLCDLYILLRPGGKLILEGPDVLGGYWYYVEKLNNIKEYIEMLFAKRNRVKYGELMAHRSGWTVDLAAEAMEKVGFKVVHKGIGLTHGMGKRDFRVEEVKA